MSPFSPHGHAEKAQARITLGSWILAGDEAKTSDLIPAFA
jgi:hypothetical protein